MKPFKNRILYFHPKKHIPAVKWTRDLNISTVEARTFCYCQNKQNITNTGDCYKYTIKILVKLMNKIISLFIKIVTRTVNFTILNYHHRNIKL